MPPEFMPFLCFLYNLITDLRLHKPLLEHDEFLRKLRVGDHLIVERHGGAYSHHGIYIGNNEVIHLQGQFYICQSSSAVSSRPNKCSVCNYVTPSWGGVVKTCLDCFHGGSCFYIREYGIRVSQNMIQPWIVDKLNASRTIYTCRKGEIYIGKWTERNSVVHLMRMDLGAASHYTFDEKYNYSPESGILETSLPSFLRGGLLYINELELHVAKRKGGDRLSSCERNPIVSIFRVLMEQAKDRVHEDWERLCGIKAGFWKLLKQETPPSFIIYQNKQIQICELTSTKSPAETVETAFSHLNRGFKRYNLFSNNCEHFATHCRTGNAMSVQSENRQRVIEDRKIQEFLDNCDPPQHSIPMVTLMNTHLPL